MEGFEDAAQLAAAWRGAAEPDEGGGGPGRGRRGVGRGVPHCCHSHRSQGERRLPSMGDRLLCLYGIESESLFLSLSFSFLLCYLLAILPENLL